MRELGSQVYRGGPDWSEGMPHHRGNGFPLKRSPSINDRSPAANGTSNGVHNENGCRGLTQSVIKGNSGPCRLHKGEKHDGSFRTSRLVLIRILMTTMAACFLAVALMQGSILMLFKHRDFLNVSQGVLVRDSDHFSVRSYVLEGIPYCERTVWAAAQNFTEHLPKRRSIHELATLRRFPRRPPRLAVICPNLDIVPDSLYLITIARGLQWLGYDVEDGHLRSAWNDIGVNVNLVFDTASRTFSIDWLNYEGVIAVSLGAKKLLASLSQEPFVDIPVLWLILENAVLDQAVVFNSSAELHMVLDSWQAIFNRSTAVVFPNYYLPIVYKEFYNKKYYVIPGSPWDVWEAEQYMMTHRRQDVRAKAGLRSDEFVIVVVGSPCVYKGIWREHALIMKAVDIFMSSTYVLDDTLLGYVRVFFLGHGNSTSAYQEALQVMARHLGLTRGIVQHVGVDEDVHGLLWMADVVVYASVLEEHAFPPILVRAMTFERPVIVPDLGAISQHIVDGENGLVFPAGDEAALGQALFNLRSIPELSLRIASEGRSLARDLLARDAVLEYGSLLEKLLDFPDEAKLPRPTAEIESMIPQGWRWDLLGGEVGTVVENATVKDLMYLRSETDLRSLAGDSDWEDVDLESYSMDDFDWLSEKDWDQERGAVATDIEERVEEDELKDRVDGFHSSFEDVNKYVKKSEARLQREEHRERENLEVERVGQPLTIYEPYHGPGAWNFLHRDHLLYRGLSLSSSGKRPDVDDIDAEMRLPLLNNSYYRDVLCEFGSFFAIANFIDRSHKTEWIGFQPWRAVSRKEALTPDAEAALVRAVTDGSDGDALYFWVQEGSHLPEDFWDMCDALNNGNCRTVFEDAFKRMYGLPENSPLLPPMPSQGGTWSAGHCWAMPTTSFLEFTMFARMFVDALDAEHYEEHHDRKVCRLARSKAEGRQCYCRVLERLVNVWAYHSGRRVIRVEPGSGAMREEHGLEGRRGTMWAKFFRGALLKSMDEDLAEEFDDERPQRRWLWPHTGEVFWRGTLDREKQQRFRLKLEKKRRQLERQARQSKGKQKPIGRYLKPEPKSAVALVI